MLRKFQAAHGQSKGLARRRLECCFVICLSWRQVSPSGSSSRLFSSERRLVDSSILSPPPSFRNVEDVGFTTGNGN
jgi:hypothetical protein